MNDTKQRMIDFLLENANPSIKYRVKKEVRKAITSDEEFEKDGIHYTQMETVLWRCKCGLAPGQPIFSLILLDSEVIVYLDLSDELLAEHCKKRGSVFQDAKNVKDAIEEAWNRQRENNDKVFYYLTVTE